MQLIHDHFQNYKRYNIPKAQLIIADIPYTIHDRDINAAKNLLKLAM